jgi:hypothetical protein
MKHIGVKWSSCKDKGLDGFNNDDWENEAIVMETQKNGQGITSGMTQLVTSAEQK